MEARDWHEDCYSPRSSQALLVEVMGVMHDQHLLGLLHPDGGPNDFDISFEEVMGWTTFDAVLRRDGRVVLTVEAKFTEEGFSKCSYPKNGKCDGTWWARPQQHRGCPMATAPGNTATADRFWNVAVQVFGVMDRPPGEDDRQTCPLWAGYQMFHNIAETQSADPDAIWVFIYDDRNPYFSNNTVGWGNVLSGRERVHVLTWQALLQNMEAHQRIQALMATHGF
jgi:hypothetical protein